MSKQQRKQIIDYIFNNPNVPAKIRRAFEEWMLTRENEAEIDEILLEMWNRHTADATIKETRLGLQRLHAAIKPGRVRMLGRRILRYAGMAAAVLLIFAGGYYFAARTVRPAEEITLLAKSLLAGLPDLIAYVPDIISRLKYPAEFSGPTREVALSGEAFFEVSKDSLRPFRVNMDNLQVEVLGTSFDAIGYSFGSHQEIILKTGSVKVSGADLGKPVLLRPDEKLSLDTRTRQVTVRQVDARNYCSWFESRLIFDNTPLADIITNLERRYNVEIALSSHIRVDKRLSLVVYHEPLEDILDVMATLIPIRYRIDGNQVLITKK